MLENNDFDKLFKDGLNDIKSIDNRDQQWEVVSQKLKKKPRRNMLWFLPLLLLVAFSSTYLLTSNKSTSDDKLEANNIYVQNNTNNDSDQSSKIDKSIALNQTNEVSKTLLDEQTDHPTVTNKSINKEVYKPEIQPTKDIDDVLQNEENSEISATVLETNIIKSNAPYKSQQTKNIEYKSTASESYVYNTYEKEQNSSLNTKGLKDQIGGTQETRHSFTFPFLNYQLKSLSIIISPSIQIDPVEIISIEIVKQKRNLKFRIGAGIFTELISQDSLIDNSNIGIQSNLNISYARANFNLGYKKNKIDRVILSKFESYNIADTNFIYGYTIPDSATLTHTNHMFDLTLGYNISPIKWIDWNIQAGILARYFKDGTINFTYGGAYQPIVNEYTVENQKFQVTDFMLGTGFHIKAYKSIGLSIEYNLVIPREIEAIKWPRRHQFELGIFYSLN